MAKTYTRKQLSSLDQLDLEQERIKYKAKRIEDNWLDTILNPQQLAFSLVSKMIGGHRSRKKTALVNSAAANLRSPKTAFSPKKNKGTEVRHLVSNFVQKPLVRKVARRVGVSFVQWQLFNLALFIGKKAWQSIKEKRTKKSWRAKPL